MYLIIRNIHLYSKNKQFSKICTNDKCLEDSCKKYLHSLTHDLYRCLAFWVAFGSSFDIGCSSKSKNKKSMHKFTMFWFLLEAWRACKITEVYWKEIILSIKPGNFWNKALCIIILSLIYSDIASKMHGVKSVYWLK